VEALFWRLTGTIVGTVPGRYLRRSTYYAATSFVPVTPIALISVGSALHWVHGRVCSAVVKANRTITSFVKHSDTLAFSVMSAVPVTITLGRTVDIAADLAPFCQQRGATLDCRSDIRQ
jgi:hypothetical protein